MATLSGNSIASTYTLLLKIDSSGIDSTLRKLEDGDATDSALSIATTSIAIDATDKFGFDGTNTGTYITEASDGVLDFYADAVQMLSLAEGSTDYVWVPVDATKMALGAGKDLQLYTSSDDAYIENITSDKDIILRVNDGGSNANMVTLDASDQRVLIASSVASASGTGAHLRLYANDGATMGDGHRLGVLEFAGAEDSSNNITVGARIEAITDAAWSASENGADMVFYTTDGNASQSEGMRLGADRKLYFYDKGGEYISSDGTDLTIAAGTAVNITADVIDLSDATKDITLNAAVDAINFDSNTLSIDASNNRVGIGTAAPDRALHVSTGSAGTITGNANAPLVLETAGDTNMQLLAPNTSDQFILFGSNSGNRTYIQVDLSATAANESFMVYTNSAQAFKIDSNSRISLSNNDSGTSNTIFGHSAGASLDAGSNYNTFIGHQVSDATMNDATYNTAVGYQALSAMTTPADYNTAIGAKALTAFTTGDGYNNALGYQAGLALETGWGNVFLGTNAGKGTVLVDKAICIGYGAGQGVMTADADESIFIGYVAGNAITSGLGNTVVGSEALKEHTTGGNNTVIGYHAADRTQGGGTQSTSAGSNNNIFIGKDTGGGSWADAESNYNTIIGNYATSAAMNGALSNTALGYGSLADLTTGDSNTSIGMESLYENTDGSNNVAVGYRAGEHDDAGSDATSPDQCIIIGAEADFDTTTPTNEIVIGYDANGKGNNTAVLGNASCTDVYMAEDSGATVHCASLMMGTTTPGFYQYTGQIAGTDTDTITITFVDSNAYWGSWHKIHIGGRLDAFNNSYCESVMSGADSNVSVVWNENSIVEEGATISAAGSESSGTNTIIWTLSDEIKDGDGSYMIFGSHPIVSITLSNA